MANLSKASNVVQERYILYDVTGFTQKWHSIPVATNCIIVLCYYVIACALYLTWSGPYS